MGQKAFTGPAPHHVMQQVHKSFLEVLHWVQLMGWMQMVSHGADLEEVGGRAS